jgi:hypothetical protein
MTKNLHENQLLDEKSRVDSNDKKFFGSKITGPDTASFNLLDNLDGKSQ